MSTERPIALITGAGVRIGCAIALRLADEGWDIGVHYRGSREAAEKVAEQVRSRGVRAALLPADLSDMAACQTLVPACINALGAPPCALINNASIFVDDRLENMTPESWRAHIDINLHAPLLLSQVFAAALPDGQSGNIVNLIDQRVWRLRPDFFSYTIAKSALWTATRTMALALAPRIRVNGIGPGPVLANPYQSEADFAEEWASTPLRRGAAPEEIAGAVVYILGTPALTGQMIALDGGQHLI